MVKKVLRTLTALVLAASFVISSASVPAFAENAKVKINSKTDKKIYEEGLKFRMDRLRSWNWVHYFKKKKTYPFVYLYTADLPSIKKMQSLKGKQKDAAVMLAKKRIQKAAENLDDYFHGLGYDRLDTNVVCPRDKKTGGYIFDKNGQFIDTPLHKAVVKEEMRIHNERQKQYSKFRKYTRLFCESFGYTLDDLGIQFKIYNDLISHHLSSQPYDYYKNF